MKLANMSSWNKKLIISPFVILLFEYLWPFSIGMQVDDPGDVSTDELANFTELNVTYNGYKFLGCFTKSIIDYTDENVLFILNYPTINFTLHGCLNEACQDHFMKFNSSDWNLVALQNQICLCIPIVLSDEFKDIGRQRLPNSDCHLKSIETVNVGGPFSFAVYTEITDFDAVNERIYHPSNNTNEHSVQDDQFESELVEIKPDSPSYHPINSCGEKEFCTLRTVWLSGIICNNTDTLRKHYRRVVIPFLYGYTPKSGKNPSYCVKYCNSLKRPTTLLSENDEVEIIAPKYTIQSEAYFYDKDYPIEFCSCTDNLTLAYSLSLQTCTSCPTSVVTLDNVCFDEHFHHRIFLTQPEKEKRLTDCPEDKKCQGKDNYGRDWMGCPLEFVSQECPPASAIPGGHSFWNCSADGNFVGEQPDFSNCISQVLKNIKNLNTSEEKISGLRNLTGKPDSKEDDYFGHEIKSINDIVVNAFISVVGMTKSNFSHRETVLEEVVDTLGNLIAKGSPWKQLDSKNRSEISSSVITSLEKTLFVFANASDDEISNSSNYTKTVYPISTDRDGFKVILGVNSTTQSIQFPQNSESYIRIRANDQLEEKIVKYAGLLIKSDYLNNLTVPILKGAVEPKAFNSMIISLSFSDQNISQILTEKGVEIKLVHDAELVGQKRITFRRKLHPGEKGKCSETTCAYWDTKLLLWATDGCEKLKRSNSRETICNCSHLTAFALLADFHEYVGKDPALEIWTLILCPLSVFCLILAFVILTRLKERHNERSAITKHLCANLIIGNLLLLLFVDKSYFNLGQEFCAAVGMTTHYVFLAALCWMAVEGHFLYRSVVLNIHDLGNNYILYYTFGAYGVPLFPVALTGGVGLSFNVRPYGGEGDMYCWLKGNYVWFFMGPIAVILCINCIMLTLTIQAKKKRDATTLRSHNQQHSNRKSLLGYIGVSVLLGLTWITGYFTLLDEVNFQSMSYVFTICNASQGIFILIFYCLLHEKMKPLILKKVGWLSDKLSKNKNEGGQMSKLKQKTKTIHPQSQAVIKFPSQGNQSQTINKGAEDTEIIEDNNLNSERFLTNSCEESPTLEDPFSRTVLSTVFECLSEFEREESEMDPLFEDTKSQRTFQRGIEEENESDDSDENSSIDDDKEEGQVKRRLLKILPYIDELEDSNLFIQFSKSNANLNIDE